MESPERRASCRKAQEKYRILHKDRLKEQRHKNKEKIYAKNKEYYIKNKSKVCQMSKRRYELSTQTPEKHAYQLFLQIRRRSKYNNIPFNLTPEDIKIPLICPILGIPLKHTKGAPSSNSPSVDRIVPSKGYVRGNIIIISFKANAIKYNANADEIMKVAIFYKNLEG